MLSKLGAHLLQRPVHPVHLAGGMGNGGIHISPQASVARLHFIQDLFRRRTDLFRLFLGLDLDGPGPLVGLQLNGGGAVLELRIGLRAALPPGRLVLKGTQCFPQLRQLPAYLLQIGLGALQRGALFCLRLLQPLQVPLQHILAPLGGIGLSAGSLSGLFGLLRLFLQRGDPFLGLPCAGLDIIQDVLTVKPAHNGGPKGVFGWIHRTLPPVSSDFAILPHFPPQLNVFCGISSLR